MSPKAKADAKKRAAPVAESEPKKRRLSVKSAEEPGNATGEEAPASADRGEISKILGFLKYRADPFKNRGQKDVLVAQQLMEEMLLKFESYSNLVFNRLIAMCLPWCARTQMTRAPSSTSMARTTCKPSLRTSSIP